MQQLEKCIPEPDFEQLASRLKLVPVDNQSWLKLVPVDRDGGARRVEVNPLGQVVGGHI